jgi:hypothetical protein
MIRRGGLFRPLIATFPAVSILPILKKIETLFSPILQTSKPKQKYTRPVSRAGRLFLVVAASVNRRVSRLFGRKSQTSGLSS